MPADVKIFSGRASRYLAERIAGSFGQPLGDINIQTFKDGEFQPNILESVRGSYVFFTQSTFAPSDNLMELLMMIDAAKRASADYITAIIPYFGLARQDRKDKPRVAIGAKLVANLITAAGANRVMTMDLHADQIQGFFDIPVDHLDGTAIFIPYLKSLNLPNLTFASPDVGGTKRTIKFAKHFNAEMVICDKHRSRPNEIASMELIGDVKGKDVILVDDIVDTANTLCNAAKLIIDKGATSVRAICTHPVLSANAYENINNSVLTEIVVADTLPIKGEHKKIKVLSVADLFSRAMKRLIDHESISSLFVNV